LTLEFTSELEYDAFKRLMTIARKLADFGSRLLLADSEEMLA